MALFTDQVLIVKESISTNTKFLIFVKGSLSSFIISITAFAGRVIFARQTRIMTRLAVSCCVVVKVLRSTDAFGVFLVRNEKQGNVTVFAIGIRSIINIYIASRTGKETEILESIYALRAVLTLGLELGLSLE